ncbi:MAG: amidohydrolase [Clostridiales bacterium]|nr:amidohydrolase [Clostridiales bacterium]
MKYIISYCIAVLLTILLAGCTETTKIGPETPEGPAYVEVSSDKLIFDADGGSVSIVVATNAAAWDYTSTGDWFTVTRKEDNTLAVETSINAGPETLTGSIVVSGEKNGDQVSATVSLVQRAERSINLSAEGTSNCYIAHTGKAYKFDASVKGNGKGDGRLQIWLGLREIMTCSPELMRDTAETAAAYHTGIHAHLCEHRDEVSFSLTHYHLRPAELLAQTGVLGSNLLTAHNVLLSDHDIALLADSGTHIIHCPKANLAHHGFPRVPTILEHGGVIGLGCDGASSVNLDMFELMRVLQLATIASQGLPIFDKQILTVKDMLRMATVGGASAIGGDTLGVVEAGKKADVILLDIRQPHLTPTRNLAVTLAYCGHGHDVTDSIIDGRVVMRDRQVLTLDEEQVMADAACHMREAFARANI